MPATRTSRIDLPRSPPHTFQIRPAVDLAAHHDFSAEHCLEPLGLSVTDAAKALGILSAVQNGWAGISPELAVRLSIGGGRAI